MAVVLDEPDSLAMLTAMSEVATRRISAGTWLEACLVVDQQRSPTATARFETLLSKLGLEIMPVTAEQAATARIAYERFGRGNHPAKLTYGDCFAYSLAKLTGEALLFKGDDFAQTDIQPVLRA